jgi:hypothetical protein
VKNDQFKLLKAENPQLTASSHGSLYRLTSIDQQAAQPVESGEISLIQYGGSAIMVRGIDGSGWIYSATVVDHAGPILTAIAEHLFDQK